MFGKPTYEELEKRIKKLESAEFDRNKAEAALKISQEYTRGLIEASLDALVTISPKGKITDVNKASEVITGLSRKEIIGTDFSNYFIIPDAARKGYQQVFRDGYVRDYPLEIKHRDGRIISVLYNASVYKDSHGNVAGVFAAARDITEHRKAEKTKSERDYLEKLTNSMWDAVFSVKMPERVIEWGNDSFGLTGYEPSEYLGKNTSFLYSDNDDFLDFGNKVKDAIETGKDVLHTEQLLKRKSGETFPAEITVTFYKENDEVVSFTSMIRDITERKQAEEVSQKRKATIQTVFDAAPVGICIMKNRAYQRVNRGWCESFGYREENLIGRTTEFLYESPEEYERVGNELFENLLKEGRTFVQTRLKRSDGELRNVNLIAKPLNPHDLEADTVVVVIHDITDFKEVEEALRKSEEQYREYFEDNIVGSYISSPEGKLITCNQEYKRIFGFDTVQQALDTPISKIFEKPDERAGFLRLLKKKKRVTGYESKLKKINGSSVRMLENASGIFDEEGNLKRIRGFLMDVTEQRKLEAQLQQVQKMESIGTLAGGIAHDFNNILFPIMGRTEMLLEDIPEDNPYHASLNEIFTSALRAKALVQQILTFSRQDTAELILMKMQPVIKEALRLIRSTIPTTIEIKQDIESDCGVIKADPTQIHQVVMNLATNAYHAMEDTGGELKVTLKEIELGYDDVINPDMNPGAYACLTIADTGTGMDKDRIEKIFDPFFTTKEQGKGTGMGLSVVHGIVASMGGAIQAYSEPGKGTEFKVYFPVEKSASEKQSTQNKEPVQGGTERILLVDDEEAIIEMEKLVLERLGYQVTSCTSSTKALEAFWADPDKFDLVITDMAMPNMPGDKLSAGLIEIRSDIPILLCTGFSETISKEKAASMGIKGFLLKPIEMKDLAQKIRDVLEKNYE